MKGVVLSSTIKPFSGPSSVTQSRTWPLSGHMSVIK